MTIFTGSQNPVKVNAVVGAASETWPDVQVFGFDVASEVAAQPLSDQETRQGAQNRARAALAAGLAAHPALDPKEVLAVGLEGGVTEFSGELWSTVWAVVCDSQNTLFEANGARIRIPLKIANLIRSGGEMGPIVAELVGEADVRSKQGMIGVVTENFVDRTEEYSVLAKLALGLWYGRNIAAKLS